MIPTLNAAETLEPLLNQLLGKVDRIVISDGQSADDTLSIALSRGAVIAMGSKGRGHQLARGARWAGEADWLLFLHADTRLPNDWRDAVDAHIRNRPDSAGYFRFGADAKGLRARAMEFWVANRTFWLKWPYGDQGLLISRAMYDAAGGYQDQILFEDVAFINALKARYGWRKIRPLRAKVWTDISAYQKDGFWRRGSRNLGLLIGYVRGRDLDALIARYK